MSVMSRTTNGKKERIALAATEKAKVWTSVRIRYLTVEIASPVRRWREGVESCGLGSPDDDGTVVEEAGGVGTGAGFILTECNHWPWGNLESKFQIGQIGRNGISLRLLKL